MTTHYADAMNALTLFVASVPKCDALMYGVEGLPECGKPALHHEHRGDSPRCQACLDKIGVTYVFNEAWWTPALRAALAILNPKPGPYSGT